MAKRGVWVGLLAATLFSASAKVTVEVTQPQHQLLSRGPAGHSADYNLSGQTLHLGETRIG